MTNVNKVLFLFSAIATGCFLALTGIFAYRYGFEAFFAVRSYIILSGSMAPAVPVGSIVLVKPEMLYQVGDVVTFRPNLNSQEMVTHRITAITPDDTYFSQGSFTTKGDANKTADNTPVPSNQVVGRMFITIPYAGYLVQFAKTPQGFVLLVIIPATIIIWEELKSTRSEISNISKRLRKQPEKEKQDISSAKKSTTLSWAVAGLVVAVAGITAVSTSVKSYFSDLEISRGNVFGAASVFATPTPTAVMPTPTPTPGIAGTLVINEVLPDTSCGDPHKVAEWIEVYNGYATTIDLKNYSISDGTNTIDLVNAVTNLPPGQFALLGHDTSIWGTGFNKCFNPPDSTITTNLGGGTFFINTGTLQLLDPGDVVIDTIRWGGTTGLTMLQNQSLERDPDGLDSASGSNFSAGDFVVRVAPMPGQ